MEPLGVQIFGIILLVFLVIVGISLVIPSTGDSKRANSKKKLVEQFANRSQLAGIFSIVLGVLILSAWVFFSYMGWEILKGESYLPIVHAAVIAVLSISLMVGGISVLRKWKNANFLFLGSIIILLFVTILSITQMGAAEHKYLFSSLIVFIGLLNLALYSVGKINWNPR